MSRFFLPRKKERPSGAPSLGSTPARGSSSGVPRQGGLPQYDLKALMKVEMRGAVWQHPDILRTVYPETCSALVLRDLQKKKIGPGFKKFLQSDGKLGERGFYQPFATLFAHVQTCTVKYVPNCYHTKHTMRVYDKAVADSVDQASALKPDLVLARSLAKRLIWRDILIPIEVKNNWFDMLLQALTYGRAVFYAQDRKWVLCILFHCTERKVRFCFCSRNGVISTPSYNLDDMDGFTATVQGFIGILSLKHETAAGILPSETIQEWLHSLTGKTYIEGECLSKRIAVRGRGTKVAVYVEQQPNSSVASALSQEADEIEARELASPIRVSQRIRNRAAAVKSPGSAPLGREGKGEKGPKGALSLLPSASGRTARDTDIITTGMKDLEIGASCSVIVKTSWPCMAESREIAMFVKLKEAGPSFGIPDILGTKVLEREPWMELFDKNANTLRHWNIFGADDNVEAKQRDCVLLALEDRGWSLESADSPRHLLECILHAMIGHGNMLGQGWLHCDVSVGNVLALDAAVARPRPEWSTVFATNESCLGMIIDGDQASPWNDVGGLPSGGLRSATWPFVSRRLITNTLTPDPGVIQTPADDLESFSWLLLWVVLKKLEQKATNSKSTLPSDSVEMRMLQGMSTDNLSNLDFAKNSIALKQIPSLAEGKLKSSDLLRSYLGPFARLLMEWWSLAEARQESQQDILKQEYGSPEEKMGECLPSFYTDYDAFFQIGMEQIPMLKEAWP